MHEFFTVNQSALIVDVIKYVCDRLVCFQAFHHYKDGKHFRDVPHQLQTQRETAPTHNYHAYHETVWMIREVSTETQKKSASGVFCAAVLQLNGIVKISQTFVKLNKLNGWNDMTLCFFTFSWWVSGGRSAVGATFISHGMILFLLMAWAPFICQLLLSAIQWHVWEIACPSIRMKARRTLRVSKQYNLTTLPCRWPKCGYEMSIRTPIWASTLMFTK